MHTFQLLINPWAISKLLGSITLLLMCASLTGQILKYEFDEDYLYGFVPVFNVDGERNIPTFFTILLALASAFLLALIAVCSRQARRYWWSLALGFLLIAYDEDFQVHERLIVPMRGWLGHTDLGFLYFGWVVPGIAGVCLLSVVFLRFLLRLPPSIRHGILVAALLYVSGCLGMELINGWHIELHGYTLGYGMLVTIEEGLEMAGLALLIHVLLQHLGANVGSIAFSVDTGRREPACLAARQRVIK